MRIDDKTELAIIIVLGAAYDAGFHSTGYVGGDKKKRSEWILKQLSNINKWIDTESMLNNKDANITHDSLILNKFKPLYNGCTNCYTLNDKEYKYFVVDNVDGKWYINGSASHSGRSYNIKYMSQINSLIYLLNGKFLF